MDTIDHGDLQIQVWPVKDDNGTSYEACLQITNYDGLNNVYLELSRNDLMRFRVSLVNLLGDLNNVLGVK